MDQRTEHIDSTTNDLFVNHKVCILLPTYNNSNTICTVIEQALVQTVDVIVVNDGSTDNTLELIKKFPVQIVSYQKNKGKGYALRKGFDFAIEHNYQYAITIDTDGQHFPTDCKQFLEALASNEGALMIGARNMNQENVPGKSSFGNRFSNFWFWLETGIKLPDTQSGFRLYPIYRMKGMHFFTNKYEFEIEVIVRSSWKGIPVIPIPIRVFYPEQSQRITHFRPFKDFSRISILNSFLVVITFLYIKPRDLLVRPLQQKGIRKGLKELLFNPNESTFTRASSVGFGIFMGIFPIWGFQLLVGIPLAIFMKMNKTLFIVAANISIFPPVIWAASLATGKLIYRNPHWKINFRELDWATVAQTGKEFLIGGAVLAFISGLLAFLLSYALLSFRRKIIENRNHSS